VARAEDDVEPIEIKLLDRDWEQRQVLAVIPPDEREVLHECRVPPEAFNRGRYASRDVEQREELGVRKSLAQNFERLLAATHSGKPVVNERDLHCPTCV
jgi:hypothetical protein